MPIIQREIQNKVIKSLFKKKIIIIYGARQVGKTTLVKEIQQKYKNSAYYNCDERDIREALYNKTSTELKIFLGKAKLIILDEAQRVKNIGLTLKLIIDNFSEKQIIATGSSSFDLSNEIKEPLTGRKKEFYLYPFSLRELRLAFSSLEINRLLEKRMIFGLYPEAAEDPKEDVIKEIASSYLYKDVLQYQNIKNPDLLDRLLQALALQIGNEVSYNELASTVGIDKNTVASYIRILEQAFIIFRLKPFSRNLRSELKKLRKIYFYDTGVRNALINNFNPLYLRNDTGALWENFMLSERLKNNFNAGINLNSYFWRTHQQQEIDYLEERKAKISAYEFKFKKGALKAPKIFQETYPGASVEIVNSDNYQKFLELK